MLVIVYSYIDKLPRLRHKSSLLQTMRITPSIFLKLEILQMINTKSQTNAVAVIIASESICILCRRIEL